MAKGRIAALESRRSRGVKIENQRQLIRRDLVTSESKSIPLDSVWIGERVPAGISFLSIPADILDEVPDIRPYRYFVTGDQVVIVAPDTREVVDIIE
jgi:Protein of unknown function (DUF1236)